MTKKLTYYELLRDPRWQKKRLEIMERDGFACVECAADDQTLNVHHTYYRKGAKPWEYENESLKTLCEDCHKQLTGALDEAKRLLGALTAEELQTAIGYLKGQSWIDPAVIIAPNDMQVYGLCDAFMVAGGGMREDIARRVRDNQGRIEQPWVLRRVATEQLGHLKAYYERCKAEKEAAEEQQQDVVAAECTSG